MRRVTAVVLAVSFLCLGAGLLRFAHDAAHAHQDAHAVEGDDNHQGEDRHHHDESNCEIHAGLSAPLAAGTIVPLLVQLGVFVAFLTLLFTPLCHLRLPARIDCRGPPPYQA